MVDGHTSLDRYEGVNDTLLVSIQRCTSGTASRKPVAGGSVRPNSSALNFRKRRTVPTTYKQWARQVPLSEYGSSSVPVLSSAMGGTSDHHPFTTARCGAPETLPYKGQTYLVCRAHAYGPLHPRIGHLNGCPVEIVTFHALLRCRRHGLDGKLCVLTVGVGVEVDRCS